MMPEANMEKRPTGRVAPLIFKTLAWAFVACVVVQTFLAGVAIFTDASYWYSHRIFVHIFEFLPILMLIFAFVARLRTAVRWHCLGLFALVYAQYFTANFPGAGALHPVLAVLIFWYAVYVARRADG